MQELTMVKKALSGLGILAVLLAVPMAGCWHNKRHVSPSSAKAITSFACVRPDAVGTIADDAKTIAVTVPFGTDITALVATFATTGASVTVRSMVQVSGVTQNDFTGPVPYEVNATDGSRVIYVVTVTIAPPLTWSVVSAYYGLSAVVWSGAQFVAVGDGILTSPDGVSWTGRMSPTAEWLNDIVWSGTQFVAMGYNGAIVTSSDGVTWAVAPQDPILVTTLSAVAWSGTQFVAVGRGSTIVTSNDGIHWTNVLSGTTGVFFGDVIWTGGEFVAVGDSGTIVTSPDGVT
jgi:hypothetical protein